MSTVRVIGAGRAGTSLARALEGRGWRVDGLFGRDDDVADAGQGVDLLVIATPDAAIGAVAAGVTPVANTVVAHLSGSLGLDVLAPHVRRAAIHPLVALPEPDLGARRLTEGTWFAVAEGGDPLGDAVVAALGGRSFSVADIDRARYHAAAVIVSNHLVALLDQVQAVAPPTVPFDAYLELARATLANVADLGPVRALTGPAARGDSETIQRHLVALPVEERDLYLALWARCREIAAR